MGIEYPVFEVFAHQRVDQEPLGSKKKFWARWDDGLWLFKFTRVNDGVPTGEDWAEKAAAEIAHSLEIPAARVELATFEGERGCLCKSFIDRDTGEALIHGNEVLAGAVAGYDKEKARQQSQHTVDNVIAALRQTFSDDARFQFAMRQLAGYLVLDALIGNTDRHHENWGVKRSGAELKIAPSFDHASSLGRELLTVKLERAMSDPGKYARKANGGLFLIENAKHGAAPLAIATDTIRRYPAYFDGWSERLAEMPHSRIEQVFECIPAHFCGDAAKAFAVAMIAHSRAALLEVLS